MYDARKMGSDVELACMEFFHLSYIWEWHLPHTRLEVKPVSLIFRFSWTPYAIAGRGARTSARKRPMATIEPR